MLYADLPSSIQTILRDAGPGRYNHRPPEALPTHPRMYVPLIATLPYGLLNASQPISPAWFADRLGRDVTLGKGFDELKEDVVYGPVPKEDLDDPNFPIDDTMSFYYVSALKCWAATDATYSILSEFGAASPSFVKPAQVRTAENCEGSVLYLVDFPLDDVIDYEKSAADWHILPMGGQSARATDNLFYSPQPTQRALRTGAAIRDRKFCAPIVRDRHTRTLVFADRTLMKALMKCGIRGPDYSVLEQIA